MMKPVIKTCAPSCAVVVAEETDAWLSPGRIPNDPEHAVALARRAKGTSMSFV